MVATVHAGEVIRQVESKFAIGNVTLFSGRLNTTSILQHFINRTRLLRQIMGGIFKFGQFRTNQIFHN
jgi:hypothetical protein